MRQTNISIAGMHCKSCELLISKSLLKIEGIKNVDTNFKTGKTIIYYKGNIDQNKIEEKVKECGYSIGENSKAS